MSYFTFCLTYFYFSDVQTGLKWSQCKMRFNQFEGSQIKFCSGSHLMWKLIINTHYFLSDNNQTYWLCQYRMSLWLSHIVFSIACLWSVLSMFVFPEKWRNKSRRFNKSFHQMESPSNKSTGCKPTPCCRLLTTWVHVCTQWGGCRTQHEKCYFLLSDLNVGRFASWFNQIVTKKLQLVLLRTQIGY